MIFNFFIFGKFILDVRMRLFIIFFLSSILLGCANGSALITGNVRPVIEDYNVVKLLNEMPNNAEKIALIKASSGLGLTQQKNLDLAVDELKRQAAKVGASAVVITERGVIPSNRIQVEIIQGIAIYIE